MKVHEPAWRLVAEGLLNKSEQARNNLAELIAGSGVAWPEVVYLADRQSVTAGLWRALEQKQLVPHLPDDAAQYLHAVYDMNSQRNAALTRQLAELQEHLASAGVRIGLLKGAALLAAGVYEDAGARIMTDLDLLVAAEDLATAGKVMDELGYRGLPDHPQHMHNHHHLPALYRPGEHASVEIHSEPLNREARTVLTAAELWEESTRRSIAGAQFSLPSLTHSVMLAIAHSEISDRNLRRLIISLRACQDIVAIVDSDDGAVDWDEIEERMRREKRAGVFRNFLYILNAVSGHGALPEIQGKVGCRARFACCRLALRHPVLEQWMTRISGLSAYRLELRFGGEQAFWARQNNRLRLTGSYLRKRFGGTRHEND